MDLEGLKIDRGRRPRRRRRRWGGLVLLALALGAGWLFRAPIVRAVDALRLPAVEVAVAEAPDARAAAAVSGTAANGYVVARNRAALSADTPGRIVAMLVEEGSVVKAGDVVARLYAEEYQAALESAEAELAAAEAAVDTARARLDEARRDQAVRSAEVQAAEARLVAAEEEVSFSARELRRVAELRAKDVQSARALDQAETAARQAVAERDAADADLDAARGARESAGAAVATAEAALAESEAQLPVRRARRDQAAATLDKTIVRAPFDGVVVLKDAEVGEVVSPNSQGASSRGSVATMVDFASLEAQVELPETSIAAVRVGAPARVFLDAYPEAPYAGRVQRIWPTANRQKATIEVRVVFDQPDERLRPEMGVRVVFEDSAAETPEAPQEPLVGVLLPEACLVRQDGGSGVFVLERDVARWVPVTPGRRQGARVNVPEGLEPGEQVVLAPPPQLNDGDRVRVSAR